MSVSEDAPVMLIFKTVIAPSTIIDLSSVKVDGQLYASIMISVDGKISYNKNVDIKFSAHDACL